MHLLKSFALKIDTAVGLKAIKKKPCPYIFISIYLVYTHNIYKTQVLKTMISKTVKPSQYM